MSDYITKQCPVCGKEFQRPFHLRRHVYCGKSCATKDVNARLLPPPPVAIYLPDAGVYLIPLTMGMSTVVDAVDSDLAGYRWHTSTSKQSKASYAYRYIGRVNNTKKRESLHRVIMARMIGRSLKSDELVDHINGNSLLNVRSNLRLATHQQNISNARLRSSNTSGFKGVSWDKARCKWVAQIGIDGKGKHLGRFDSPELAHEAYVKAARLYHGEFANDGTTDETHDGKTS